MIGIYAIFRKSDDKCMYVGQSKNIKQRLYAHFCDKNKRFNYDEYYYKVVEEFDTYDRNRNLDREAYWINKLNAELNEWRNRQPSEKWRKEQSERMKGEKNSMYGADRHGENSPWYGKKFSEEHRRKIGIASKKRTPWNKGLTKETDERVKKYANSLIGHAPTRPKKKK